MANQSSEERYIAKFPKSRVLYEKAKGVFPRGTPHDSWFVLPFPIYISHAKGSHEWDVDGYEYVDYFGGHGALILGHAHPSLVTAVNEQIQKGTHYGACHELQIEWAELIRKLIPSAERVEFTNSGTESNMLAIRLARSFTGRNKIVRFRGQFAGWFDHVMVGIREPWDIPTSSGLLAADIEDTIVIPVNNQDILENTLSNRDVALLMVEPAGAFSGASGITPSFYRTMRDLTKQYGTLLLFDEVVTGLRYSPGGVQAAKGIVPDLTSLGKTITGGVPGAGAVVGRVDVMDMLLFKDDKWNRYKRVSHPGTFNANPLCAAAGIATLKILATGEPQKKANELSSILRQGMQRVMGEKGVVGCVYGDFSVYHIYFGKCEMQGKCDRTICLNDSKVRPADVGRALYINLALNGVHTASRGVDGYISAVHTKNDIDKTVEAFDISLGRMIEEGMLKTESVIW